MNAHDMVQTCFRHQHPEAYGGQIIEDPSVPLHGRRHCSGQRPIMGLDPS